MTDRRPRCTAPKCGRPQHNGLLCTGCTEGLDTDLLEVSEVWPELLITRTRQDQVSDGTPGSAARPLPWNEQASQASDALAAAVRALDALAGPLVACDVACHRCAAQIGAQGSNPDPRPLARWLWTARPELVLAAGIGPVAARLDSALGRARAATDRPEYERRFEVGPCPRPGESSRWCSGVIWALIPAREQDPAVLACSVCAHRWDCTQWLRAGREIHARRRAMGQDPDGRAAQVMAGTRLVSRDTLRRITGRAQSVITKHCHPVVTDELSRTQLYDAEVAITTLAQVPTRMRPEQPEQRSA